ncbi:hypothetical protein B296_00018108, partial [Ensete ventricosum]
CSRWPVSPDYLSDDEGERRRGLVPQAAAAGVEILAGVRGAGGGGGGPGRYDVFFPFVRSVLGGAGTSLGLPSVHIFSYFCILGVQHGSRKDLEKEDYPITRHPEFRYKTEFQSHEPEVLCS